MKRFVNRFQGAMKRESGTVLTEHAFLSFLIAVVCVVVLQILGIYVKLMYEGPPLL